VSALARQRENPGSSSRFAPDPPAAIIAHAAHGYADETEDYLLTILCKQVYPAHHPVSGMAGAESERITPASNLLCSLPLLPFACPSPAGGRISWGVPQLIGGTKAGGGGGSGRGSLVRGRRLVETCRVHPAACVLRAAGGLAHCAHRSASPCLLASPLHAPHGQPERNI
jgi:hypothetical protein